MDCREFRKQHFAYLDDTLPGDTMAVAQQHVMKCDACAAHDTMVRRSLMLVRNVPALEPSADFRKRMQIRLDEARCEKRIEQLQMAARTENAANRASMLQPVMLSFVVATVFVAGTLVWRARTPEVPQLMTMQAPLVSKPIFRTPSESTPPPIYVSPAMLQAMATGNPMWPAALMVDEAPTQLVGSEFTQVKATR
ncbi:MAG: zf-HC2 domain-containing protein [Gemmatimonadota bacterium]|nr:zf-HC2 domain-containing protein [Gemmatimonadota bacterium]